LRRKVATEASALAYSIPDAAARIGISRSTLYALISAGQIPIAKIGSRTLVLDQEGVSAMRAHAAVYNLQKQTPPKLRHRVERSPITRAKKPDSYAISAG
jgi:excisionase family DNA binding protein